MYQFIRIHIQEDQNLHRTWCNTLKFRTCLFYFGLLNIDFAASEDVLFTSLKGFISHLLRNE
jgi:hypothetical protein